MHKTWTIVVTLLINIHTCSVWNISEVHGTVSTVTVCWRADEVREVSGDETTRLSAPIFKVDKTLLETSKLENKIKKFILKEKQIVYEYFTSVAWQN